MFRSSKDEIIILGLLLLGYFLAMIFGPSTIQAFFMGGIAVASVAKIINFLREIKTKKINDSTDIEEEGKSDE